MDILAQIARAIANEADSGTDPERAASYWVDKRVAEIRKAVKLAQAHYGLSAEAEWAEDFLYAHRYYRLRKVEQDIDYRA